VVGVVVPVELEQVPMVVEVVVPEHMQLIG
jgi:hypothetical protein